MADETKKPQGIFGALQAANPILKAANIASDATALQQPSPATPATSVPRAAASTRLPSGDIELPSEKNVQVQWADPSTGKRMWGTKLERDRAMGKKAPTNGARPLSKR